MKNIKSSVGFFGGLFDPPHIGHLIIAQWVLSEFKLDKIVFVPAFNPPHKKRYSSYQHRYAMTYQAIKNNGNFLISDIEKKIPGKSYTFEVIRAFKKNKNTFRKSNIYLIIGADQWQEIKYWKNPEIIFRKSRVIVLPRPGYKIKKIKTFYDKILISNAPLIGISSTMIRKKIKKGLSIDYLVVPEVLAYIKKNKLYV